LFIEVCQKISTLKYIDLSGNQSSPWAVYCAVIRHCCINSLTVCGDEGMERHVEEIADSLEVNKVLKSLRLRSIGRIGHWLITEVLDKIKISISVDSRNKLHNERTDSCSENVADGIDVGGDNFPNIANMGIGSLAGLIIVQSLDLSCNNISDDEVLTIVNALKCNNVLKELDLSSNNITSIGMSHLLESVRMKSMLEFADLSGNYSTQWDVYCHIIRHCSVNSLTLVGDYGMEEYVEEVTDSLEANRGLETLTLGSMGRIGAESMKTVLVNNTTLSKVNLSWKKISNVGEKKHFTSYKLSTKCIR